MSKSAEFKPLLKLPGFTIHMGDLPIVIAFTAIGLGVGYFLFRHQRQRQVKKQKMLIPPMATNEFTYPMTPDQYRAMKTNEDYSDFERYISWDVANIHPSYKEYLKYRYGLF